MISVFKIIMKLIILIKNLKRKRKNGRKIKKKFEKTGVVKQLRERTKFTKPSVVRRTEMIKARYVEGLRRAEQGN